MFSRLGTRKASGGVGVEGFSRVVHRLAPSPMIKASRVDPPPRCPYGPIRSNKVQVLFGRLTTRGSLRFLRYLPPARDLRKYHIMMLRVLGPSALDQRPQNFSVSFPKPTLNVLFDNFWFIPQTPQTIAWAQISQSAGFPINLSF